MTSVERAMPPSSRRPARGLFAWVVVPALLLPRAGAAEPAPPKLRRTLGGSKDVGRVNCVAVSPDGKTPASGSDDNTIMLWDLVPAK